MLKSQTQVNTIFEDISGRHLRTVIDRRLGIAGNVRQYF